jgi:pSer/pThr/pTyr-binding forkhead associated (FHA) protein
MIKMCLAMETADGGDRCFPISRTGLVLGRDTRCDLRIAVPSVSMRHCEIVVEGNTLLLNDLGSTTGTFHNGIRILRAELAPHDRVTIGPVSFVVRPVPSAEPTTTVAEMKPQLRATRSRPAAAEASNDA